MVSVPNLIDGGYFYEERRIASDRVHGCVPIRLCWPRKCCVTGYRLGGAQCYGLTLMA